MGRIEERFIKARKENQAILIPYLTIGYPKIEITYELVLTLERAGAGMIELGIPFSDPLADAPTIQYACTESLKVGTSLSAGIELVRSIRKLSEIPLIFMTYYNPVYKYGVKKFIEDAQSAGVDGVIIPDLPPEEAKELKEYADNKGFCIIFLLAPTSTPSRRRLISNHSTGFIYYVSLTGITGAREKLSSTIEDQIKELRLITTKPIVVGFGVSTPEHVRWISSFADGIVVGSALIDLIKTHQDNTDLTAAVEGFIRSLVTEIKR